MVDYNQKHKNMVDENYKIIRCQQSSLDAANTMCKNLFRLLNIDASI